MLPRFSVPKPPDFSFGECLWYLDRNFDDCMHHVKDAAVVKLFYIAEQPLLLKIYEGPDDLGIDVLHGKVDEVAGEEITSAVSEWFDLARELLPLRKLSLADPEMAQLVAQHWGLRIISIPDLFEALCWSIIGQQINLRFAYKIKRKLVEATVEPLVYQGVNYYRFPTPEQVLKLSVEELRGMQFSVQKARYILLLARNFALNQMSRKSLLKLPDTPSMVRELSALKGIGEWTANYVAMKCLRRMDAITYTDAGLLNGYRKLKNLPCKPERTELEIFFERFPDWQAYVVFYIWRSLS